MHLDRPQQAVKCFGKGLHDRCRQPQAELLAELDSEDLMKQKASKSRAAKKAKKKAARLAATAEGLLEQIAGGPGAASPASPADCRARSHVRAGSRDETAPRGRVSPSELPDDSSPAAEPAVDSASSAEAPPELDLSSVSLAEQLSGEQTPQEQWEVQPRGRRAASKKAAPQVAPHTPAVLEVRISSARRLSGPSSAEAGKSQRFTSEAEKLPSPESPPLKPSPAQSRMSGRWAAVVAGVPLPQSGAPSTPLLRPLPPPPPQEFAWTPPPPAPPVAAPGESRGGASPVSPAIAAWQAAAQEPAADVSRASSYSLWGGGMSDFSRASLPLSSSRDSLSAISDVSLYGSPPVFGSQQLSAGSAISHGASRAKPATLSPLFTGKANPGIWSTFSLGPAASPFGGAFALGSTTAAGDSTPFATQQQATAAMLGAGGCHAYEVQLFSRHEALSAAGW